MGVRIVDDVKTGHGGGSMVLLDIAEAPDELSLWGRYLLEQVRATEPNDLRRRYMIVREVVPGFSARPVKILVPAPDLTAQEDATVAAVAAAFDATEVTAPAATP